MDKGNVLISMFPDEEGLKQLEIFNASLTPIFSEWLDENRYETELDKGLYAARLTGLTGNQYEKTFEITGEGETSVLLGDNQTNKSKANEKRNEGYFNEIPEQNLISVDRYLRPLFYDGIEERYFRQGYGYFYQVSGDSFNFRNANLKVWTRSDNNSSIYFFYQENLYIIRLPVSERIDCKIEENKGPKGYVRELVFDLEVTNKEAGAILRLMISGDIERAKTLADHIQFAEQLLFDKIENPSYAALGGYFLLRTNAMEQLHDWPRNLAKWFKWFPDGCIIYATQLMRSERPNVEEIERLLLQAYQRGMPLYTEGLRLLHDGLMKLYYMEDNRKKRMIEVAYKEVQRWMSFADTDSGFTVLCIPSHEKDYWYY